MNPSSSHVENTPQPCRQSTKLKIMIISIKSKVLIKFDALWMLCVESRSIFMCTNGHVTNVTRTCTIYSNKPDELIIL